jgi:hypothetical protein
MSLARQSYTLKLPNLAIPSRALIAQLCPSIGNLYLYHFPTNSHPRKLALGQPRKLEILYNVNERSNDPKPAFENAL